MQKNICVFCSSSDVVDKEYFEAAVNLGKRIADEKDNLLYGGGKIGLMGELARSAKQAGAHITGVIPQRIHDFGVGWQDIDEYIITEDMSSRKSLLIKRSDVFIALPGGFGTLEEILEVLTLKQLGYHQKPIIFLNVNGFFDGLLVYFEELFTSKFAKPYYKTLYAVCRDVKEVYGYLEDYIEPEFKKKWH